MHIYLKYSELFKLKNKNCTKSEIYKHQMKCTAVV